uniref:Uncharacterized protein n=1 Tax=Physcomitrium patens TaxID=3218 RepID=A0A2K1KVJ0_PHYPA|nr:hypothetical protein PHYPA_004806 [Physcomitrium patens]
MTPACCCCICVGEVGLVPAVRHVPDRFYSRRTPHHWTPENDEEQDWQPPSPSPERVRRRLEPWIHDQA